MAEKLRRHYDDILSCLKDGTHLCIVTSDGAAHEGVVCDGGHAVVAFERQHTGLGAHQYVWTQQSTGEFFARRHAVSLCVVELQFDGTRETEPWRRCWAFPPPVRQTTVISEGT